MCDINPDKLEVEEKMVCRKKNLYGSVCMKCKEERAVVVVRVGDPLCTSCFLTYTTHKFRSTLGKSKLIQANDNVLIALSGGHSSTALIHLVKDALSEGAHKRLRFSPGVICVDETATLPSGIEQDYTHIKELVEHVGYPYYEIPIYKGFTNVDNNIDNYESDGNDKHGFVKCFESISTLTARQDFLITRRVSLIVDVARKHNYKKIMFGDTATSLSIKLLYNISLGRGSSIPMDIGIADNRYSDITIVRPMRELSSKEVAMYNRFRQINIHVPYNIITMKNNNSSLQNKTEEFIIGLQTDFPHTVNTVFRTGDKICKNEKFENCSAKCSMCQNPLLNNLNMNEEVCDEDEGCCGSSDECTSKQSFRLSTEEMKRLLCYSCNLTFKDMGYNMDILPKEILENASIQMKRQRMKESIQDFLLE